MRRVKLSIIVPFFNCQNTINRCIESIFNSTFVDFELLLINDASTDESLEIISKFSERKEIRIISLEKNRGVSYCRNLGIKEAVGEFLTFVDADDYIDAHMYELMMNKIETEVLDCCVSNYVEVFGNGRIQSSKYLYKENAVDTNKAIQMLLTDKVSPAVWDKIFRTEIIKNANQFDTELEIGEDILFCLNVFKYTSKIGFLNDVMYYYVQNTISAMHTVSPKLLQFTKVTKSIPLNDYKRYKNEFYNEFEYFESSMMLRGIHSLTTLLNMKNRSIIYKFICELYNKDLLKKQLHSKYTSKFVKLEVFILLVFGVKVHMFLQPMYLLGRKVIRR